MVDTQPGIQRERMNGILRQLLDNGRLTRATLASALRLSPSSIVKRMRTKKRLSTMMRSGTRTSRRKRKQKRNSTTSTSMRRRRRTRTKTSSWTMTTKKRKRTCSNGSLPLSV